MFPSTLPYFRQISWNDRLGFLGSGILFYGKSFCWNNDSKYETSKAVCVHQHSQKMAADLWIHYCKCRYWSWPWWKNKICCWKINRRKFKMGTFCCRLLSFWCVSVFSEIWNWTDERLRNDWSDRGHYNDAAAPV